MKTPISKTTNSARKSFLKSSALVFAGTTTANIASYLYHLLMGRILGPVSYGELASLISLLYILGVPTIVLQTTLIKLFSRNSALDENGKSHQLFMEASRYMAYILIGIGLLLVIVSPVIAGFLHLTSWTLVIWLAVFFVFSTLSIISNSVISGYQIFTWVAAFAAIPTILKVIFSTGFAVFGIQAAMAGMALSAFLTYGFFLLPVRFLFDHPRRALGIPKIRLLKSSIPTLLTILGATSLYSTDVILAKHYLPSLESGIYSAVAVMGKIIFFASSAITTVLFPVVSARAVKGEKSTKVILMALFLIGSASTALTLGYALFPDIFVNYLFGKSYAPATPYLALFGIFMVLYSLGQNLAMVCLAQNKTFIGVTVFLTALLHIVLLIVFGKNISSIVWTNIVTGGIFFLSAIGVYIYQKHPDGGIQ